MLKPVLASLFAVLSIAPLAACKPSDPAAQPTGLSAVWANDGGDKVTRDERRATADAASVVNSVWDGDRVRLSAARNEVVAFNLVLEAGESVSRKIGVKLESLTGPGGAQLHGSHATGDGVFDWRDREIELFYVRYLAIHGLSRLSYETYDERHVPKRMQRPWTGAGSATGGWASRPDHDKEYPEIAVPLERAGEFEIAAGTNQSVWADIYVPTSAAPGLYTGHVVITEGGAATREIPVELRVRGFALPDEPTAKTMIFLGYGDVNERYTGTRFPNQNTPQDATARLVRDRHFQLAHRHKLSLIDQNDGSEPWSQDAPRPAWLPRLNGQLFTAAKGYAGPGEGVGNGVFSVGTYGSWGWKSEGESGMRTHTDAWASWFSANAPSADYFLYLIDESTNYAQIQQWADWVNNNPGPGRQMRTFATMDLTHAVASAPSLDIAASWFVVGDTSSWQNAVNTVKADPAKRFYCYNGKRPASGSFATEDDGVALRELPWGQYKKGIDRWFFWESTYYNDYQSGRGQNHLYRDALTFGSNTTSDPVAGRTGWNYSNGDGVLFYPGTDTVDAADSYGLNGPIASLRMKHWRRGIQDVDYLALARAVDPARTQAILNARVPKAMWEYGIQDPSDPTWVRTDISWSTNPDDWEDEREQLARIIEGS